jgi:Na+/H+ antiporter NhaC
MDWLVLLPPLIAIGAALITRQVFVSLFAGLWVGTTMLMGGNPLLGLRELLDQMVAVFASAGNTRVIIFCILVGGLIALVQASGGVQGFVDWMQARGLGRSRRGAELMAWMVGVVIFVESNITSLVVGAVGRPFFDRLRLPREKLAFYCDATSAPVCMSIPLNGWGAYVLGLLAAQNITTSAVELLATSLVFNFFSLLAIAFAFVVAVTGWGFGPMQRAEERAAATGHVIRPGGQPLVAEEVTSIAPEPETSPKARDLLVPLATMVGMIFVGLWVTGEGDITAGSGSTAVLWAVASAIGVAILLYAVPRRETNGKPLLSVSRSVELTLKGSSGLVSVTVLIVFAFALGQVSRALEMGLYLAGIVEQGGPGWWIPALVFGVGGFVSFTLGSSWTSFAILIPIAMPLASGLELSPALMLGAVLSGGVFGDYSSPLSDTSIISSMAAASDHIDHVNTQLPYALFLAGLSVAAFLIAGATMH